MNVKQITGDYNWDGLLTFIQDNFAYMNSIIDPPSSICRLTTNDLKLAETILVIEGDVNIVACCICTTKHDALYIGKIAVDSTYRGQGLAHKIIVAAEDVARRKNLTTLELQTRVELTQNHRAFAALGFEKTGESAHDGYDQPTSITMHKTVKEAP